MKYVIIGSGPAGAYAAKKLRELNNEIDITIITEESYGLYARPRLPEFISGKVSFDKMILFKKDWYEKNKINLKTDTLIDNIDIEKKYIISLKNEKFFYDKLLIASGSKPFCPAFKIKDNSFIYTLSTLKDAEKIKEKIKTSCSVTVIGAGLLGLELANNFRELNLKVNLIEKSSYLLSRQLDKETGLLLEKKIKDQGIKIFFSSNINEINSNVVVLDNGQKIVSDFILISIGLFPVLDIAKKINLKIEKGIIINDNMQTNISDIYSAGDCSMHNKIIYGFWMASKEQGECAAENMLGKNIKYKGSYLSAVTNAAGIDIGSIGDINNIYNLQDVKIFTKESEKKYLKLFVKNDILIGSVFLGNIKDKKKLRENVNKKENIKNKEKDFLEMCF